MSNPAPPYSPVVVAGDWLIVSGQIGMFDGALVPGGVQDEMRQAITNLSELLTVARLVAGRRAQDHGLPAPHARLPA